MHGRQQLQLLLVVSAALLPGSCLCLSPHFRQWLAANGHRVSEFARDDLQGGSFGGRESASDAVSRQPVVFVHGNSDRAAGGRMGGWTKVAEYFKARGYKSWELYATTWGPANVALATQQQHTRQYVQQIRSFIQAVLQYTGARQVDVISHSMGVTLARKAIKGGRIAGHELGPPLTSRVDTFVGIAGGNYGLTACYTAQLLPSCSRVSGFFPGVFNPLLQRVTQRSAYLDDLLSSRGYEGSYRYSLWSPADEVITLGCVVYGTVTCRFPAMTGEKRMLNMKHLELKSNTASVQYSMVTSHIVP